MRARAASQRKAKSSSAGVADTAAHPHESTKDDLSPAEVTRLLNAAKGGWHGVRPYLTLLMTYRYGLQIRETVGSRRDEIDLDHTQLWLHRLKGGLLVGQPIAGDGL